MPKAIQLTKKQMITEILLAIKANRVTITGDLRLGLSFRDERELRGMCRELHIKTTLL